MPGHWEGDLILGAGNSSAVATLVERNTRYTLLGHLPLERTGEAVRDSLIATLAEMPTTLRRTLTWDKGAEMSEHRGFILATSMTVHFCDRASPWQRGSNENTNGLLRQYLPKRTTLALHDAQALAAIADELNGRPRKALDWDTPTERMAALLHIPPVEIEHAHRQDTTVTPTNTLSGSLKTVQSPLPGHRQHRGQESPRTRQASRQSQERTHRSPQTRRRSPRPRLANRTRRTRPHLLRPLQPLPQTPTPCLTQKS